MKRFVVSLLLAMALLAQASPLQAAFAQPTFQLTPANSTISPADKFRKSEIVDFLNEFQVVKTCLRNRRSQERRPLTAAVAACITLTVFDSPELSLNETWTRAKKLRILDASWKRSTRINTFDFLGMLFEVAGVTVSPLSEREYKKAFTRVRLRLTNEQRKTLSIAIEHGLISEPGSTAEAKLLKKDLEKSRLRTVEAFVYLYQLATGAHEGITAPPSSRPPSVNVDVGGGSRSGLSAGTVPLEGTLSEIITLLETQSYYSSNFDKEKAMEAAIKAFVQSLEEDKYIQWYTPQEYEDFSSGLNGEFKGIGAYIEEKDGKIMIVSPIQGSPADEAGLQPGDVITHIDGVTTEGLSLQQAVERIRGPEGSTVTLRILRDGTVKDYTITRGLISVPSLTTENQDGVEIIRLIQFNGNSALEVKAELERIAAAKPRGLVIDLRNNPGGFLNEVVSIVDYFLERNEPTVYIQDRNIRTGLMSGSEPIIEGIPVAILINKGSASASEIMAGALQSYGVAKLYGETSFGKGTVQNIVPLIDPNRIEASALKFTTAEYLIPKGEDDATSIDGVGIHPDSNPGGIKSFLDNPDTEVDEVLQRAIDDF